MEEYYGVIYSVINKTNNKKYIGQTTQSFERRKHEHIITKGQNKTSFQNALNKYGVDNFIWEIIDYANSEDELDDKEVFWIDYYNTYGRNGYNMTIGGQRGVRQTLEGRIQLFTKYDNRIFYAFDMKGNFLEETNNRLLFCVTNNIRTNECLTVLNNIKPSANNFILIYKDDYTEDNLKQRINRTRNREFVAFDKYNNYMGLWTNQTLCGNDLKLHRGTISKCLNNIRPHYYGYRFYYLDRCPDELKDKLPVTI